MRQRFSHVIGFDDAPFDRAHRGDVLVVGAVFAGTRLDGVLSGKVRRDGANSTRVFADLVRRSRFRAHLHLVMLQGIAMAGFNVVDIEALAGETGLPVLVVMRRRPNMERIRRALLANVRGGRAKLRLIERAGPIEPAAGLFVQRAGVSLDAAVGVLRRLALAGHLPEPLRVAHLVAGGVATGESRHRA
ncbi:MAG: DUF99 family protein [Burkholderiales bacterium]|jgi:hypothetical protein|nr:DUF99 family protein [Burkholderiales bacterium]